MKYDKSLEEVWGWKDKGYQRIKGLTLDEKVKKIREGAKELCEKYGLKLKKLRPSEK